MSQKTTIELALALRKVERMHYISPAMERIAQAIEEELRKRATAAWESVCGIA